MEAKQQGFYATELVPRSIFNRYALNSWWFIDPKIVAINAQLKKDFGKPIIINNWNAGGSRQYCGYRPINCAVGADNSQHRHGRATDTIVSGIDANEVRQYILKYKKRYMALGLTTLEDAAFAPTWVHLDCRYTGLDDILIVKP